MNTDDAKVEYRRGRETTAIGFQATIYFTVSIAAIGAIMMTLTSSPTAKGASFLWIPAALQLMAGVWLGPWRGMIAGGLGAYLAGILAYGGWGLVDIIMNPIAGGLANSLMPAVLFRLFRVDPTFGTPNTGDPKDILRAAGRLASLLAGILILSFAIRPLQIGAWGYLPPFLVILLAPLVLTGLAIRRRDFILGFVICIFISAVSAIIGSYGQVVGGQTWQAALLGTGLGWFFGDTVSAILGLYMLAAFTERAREAGIAS
jgi:uncharacterized membrane protein